MIKQIFRYLLVLLIAVALGFGVYYLFNASAQNTSAPQFQQGGFNPAQRPPRDFQGERDGASIFGVVGILGKFILISAIIYLVVKIQNFVLARPSIAKRE